jgi:DNA polymerase-3 subunit beta
MKFFVNAKTISNALSIVGRAISGKPTQPILGTVKLTTLDNDAVLTGFNLSMAITHRIDIDNVDDNSSICIPYALLTAIAAKLTGDLTLEIEESMLLIKSETGQYKINTLSADDYPDLPEVTGEVINLSGDTLRTAINTVSSSASDDDTKQVLTGINLQTKNERLYFNATNGHVLSRYWSDGCVDELNVTIPAYVLTTVSKHLLGDISLLIGDGQVKFWSGDLTVIGRILDGAYPAVDQLIPVQFERVAIVDSGKLKEAVSRVATFSDQKNNLVKLSFNANRLTVASDTLDIGQGVESLPSELTGEPVEIGLNLKYLNAGINALSASQLKININQPNQPVIITCPDSNALFLAMPVQIIR